MAKRVRSNRGAYRPGGQGPNRTKETEDGAAEGTDLVTADLDDDQLIDDIAYSEVEVDEVAAAAVAAATATPQSPAQAPTRRSARAPRRERHRPKARSDELAARGDAESTWVREDLLRIGWVSVILVVALAVCWVLFGFLDVLGLY